MIVISPPTFLVIAVICAIVYLLLVILVAIIKNRGIADNNARINSGKFNDKKTEIEKETTTLKQINPFTAPAFLVYDFCRGKNPIKRYEDAAQYEQNNVSFAEKVKNCILERFPCLGYER